MQGVRKARDDRITGDGCLYIVNRINAYSSRYRSAIADTTDIYGLERFCSTERELSYEGEQ